MRRYNVGAFHLWQSLRRSGKQPILARAIGPPKERRSRCQLDDVKDVRRSCEVKREMLLLVLPNATAQPRRGSARLVPGNIFRFKSGISNSGQNARDVPIPGVGCGDLFGLFSLRKQDEKATPNHNQRQIEDEPGHRRDHTSLPSNHSEDGKPCTNTGHYTHREERINQKVKIDNRAG